MSGRIKVVIDGDVMKDKPDSCRSRRVWFVFNMAANARIPSSLSSIPVESEEIKIIETTLAVKEHEFIASVKKCAQLYPNTFF